MTYIPGEDLFQRRLCCSFEQFLIQPPRRDAAPQHRLGRCTLQSKPVSKICDIYVLAQTCE